MSAKRQTSTQALFNSVYADCAPILIAIATAESNERREAQTQGYTADLVKYCGNGLRFSFVVPDSDNGDVARSNDAWQSVRVASMDKAASEISPVLV